MTETGTIQSRTHEVTGDTVTIDGVIYMVPEYVEKFLARRKDGEQVDFDYETNVDGTTRTVKKIMPHGGPASSSGKNATLTGESGKLTTREGILLSIDGSNLVTIQVAGQEKHYGILPGLVSDIRDKVDLPQNIAFSFNGVSIIQEITLRDHVAQMEAPPKTEKPVQPAKEEKKAPLPDASTQKTPPADVERKQVSNVMPSAVPSNEPQIIIHRHEGEDHTRPDSITFGESTKIPGLKIYVNLAKPEEMTEIIDHAFVAYSYALNKMVQMKEQEPQLFPGGAKA